jgi:hypothetical protein
MEDQELPPSQPGGGRLNASYPDLGHQIDDDLRTSPKPDNSCQR